MQLREQPEASRDYINYRDFWVPQTLGLLFFRLQVFGHTDTRTQTQTLTQTLTQTRRHRDNTDTQKCSV